MMWKALVFAFLLAGVFAEYELTEEKKNEIKNLLRMQCSKAGAEDKTDEVSNAAIAFADCTKQLVNVEQIKNEIEAAKPNGALDEVFKKYCAKTPQLKTCIHTFMAGVSPCVDASLRDQFNKGQNITDQLIDFVCYKDGDRIALFIAENGVECFQEKANALRECATKVKSGVATVESAKSLSIAEQCAKYDELSTCVVTALEQCTSPTPGNMAESLFRYVRKSSPCNTA